MQIEDDIKQRRNNKFLNIIRFNVYFNELKTYDVEAHDLYELISMVGCDCLNIITIKKNSFFMVLRNVEEAFRVYKKLNNYFIEKTKGRIEIKLCSQGDHDRSSFGILKEKYKAIF